MTRLPKIFLPETIEKHSNDATFHKKKKIPRKEVWKRQKVNKNKRNAIEICAQGTEATEAVWPCIGSAYGEEVSGSSHMDEGKMATPPKADPRREAARLHHRVPWRKKRSPQTAPPL